MIKAYKAPCGACEGTGRRNFGMCPWCEGKKTVIAHRVVEEELDTGTEVVYDEREVAAPTQTRSTEMSDVRFVQSDEKKGKKFTQVVTMLEELRDAKGEPVPFDTLCAAAGAKYPQDVQAAMFALELVEVVDRYTYTEKGSTRSSIAYALRAEVASGDDPSRGASAPAS